MKKYIALLLALLLAVGLTACGASGDDADTKRTTTGSASATTSAESTTVPDGTQSVSGTETTAAPTTEATNGGSTAPTQPSAGSTTTVTTATTSPAPTGATVPIGTKPPVTTTQAPTTTTTTNGKPSTGGSTTATTTTPTTTPTTAKPTEPPVQGPYIVLPAIGSDIDVTRKKDRIRVSGVAAWFNEDGTIGVRLTFKNYSSNWITEETDYVEYTCYDKNGNVVQKATRLPIGVIDTKKNSTKAFDFNVPANTAEVKITKSDITYWTEWA
ncbi:MAG: hypothetical protein IJB36_01615 [Clostridia bacterium]|nr:hypothetical protein [Clostridia bacterium]